MNKQDKDKFRQFVRYIYINIALNLNNLKQRYLLDYDMLYAFNLIDKIHLIEPETIEVLCKSKATILLRHLPNLYVMYMLGLDVKTLDNYSELLVSIDKDTELSLRSVGKYTPDTYLRIS